MIDRDVVTANQELAKINRVYRKKKNKNRQTTDLSPFYSIEQVLELVPISKSNLYLMIKNDEFPSQIKLGKRTAVWSKEVIHSWIDSKLGL